jgi:hypothetical protein
VQYRPFVCHSAAQRRNLLLLVFIFEIMAAYNDGDYVHTLRELLEIVKVNKGQIGQPENQVKIKPSGQ